jgi:hypothetical protein
MKGQMGTAAGFQWAMDQNCPTHVSGIYTTAGTVAAGLTGAAIATTGWTGAALKAGDIVTFAGVYAINPQSRASTGQLQQFTLTAATSSATVPTLNISPAIIATGPLQNVSNATTAGAVAVLTPAAGSSNPLGLAFHRDAFTLVTADLPVPKGTDMASRVSDKQLGISLRIVRDYDITTDQFPCRIDVLYGWAALRPELACRVYAA